MKLLVANLGKTTNNVLILTCWCWHCDGKFWGWFRGVVLIPLRSCGLLCFLLCFLITCQHPLREILPQHFLQLSAGIARVLLPTLTVTQPLLLFSLHWTLWWFFQLHCCVAKGNMYTMCQKGMSGNNKIFAFGFVALCGLRETQMWHLGLKKTYISHLSSANRMPALSTPRISPTKGTRKRSSEHPLFSIKSPFLYLQHVGHSTSLTVDSERLVMEYIVGLVLWKCKQH